MKRSGSSPTLRTASSTPGMNERRSIESWRIAERLALAAEDHFLVGDQARQPHRVDRLVDVAAGARRSAPRCASPCPRARRACWSWCSSTISHSGMCGAIVCATSISSTAPIAKLGATKQLALPSASAAARSASRSKPVVPTTAWTPASRQAADVGERGVGRGEVDDDVGVAEHVGQLDPERRDRPCPPAPCPSAPSTASQTGLRPSARRRPDDARPGSCRLPAPR